MAISSQVAYGVYYYSARATGDGEVGRVDYDKDEGTLAHYESAQSADGNIAGLKPDPKVFWFENAEGDGRLLISQTYYDEDYNPELAKFSVHDAATLGQVWPTPAGSPPITQTWGSLLNVYNIVTLTVDSVKYIYGIDYDTHLVFRVAIGANDSNYAYDNSASYPYTRTGSNYTYGVDIATDGSNIYALFINAQARYGGPYDPSTIVKLNTALTTAVVNENLAKNALSLKLWTSGNSGYFYIPAIGGPQNMDGTYNTGSVIQRIPTNFTPSTAPQNLLVNAQTGTGGDENTTDYYDIAFKADGTKVFILKGIYTDSSTFRWRLYLTTMDHVNGTGTPASKLISDVVTDPAYKADGTSIYGFVWALYFNPADGNVWFVRGNEIVICDLVEDEEGNFQLGDATVPIVMGGDPTANLAPGNYSINGVTIYGFVGIVKGAPHPAGNAAQQAAAQAAAQAASAEGEEEEER
jgi:hypothetical protein